jgi:cytochrome P450
MDQAPRRLPETGLADLLRLGLTMAGGVVRHPRTFTVRELLRQWTRETAERCGNLDFVVRIGPKRLVFVGSSALSTAVLDEAPRDAGVSAGDAKRGGMSFLAPQALTIAHDDQWTRLRAFNEDVLEPGRRHDDEAAILDAVRRGFDAPIADEDDIRAAMGRTMIAVVFGAATPPAAMVKDVDVLFGYVQSPLKRLLLGPLGRRRLARFRAEIARAYGAAHAPSLAARASRSAGDVSLAEQLDQVPHWMFTFVRSGTALLARSLALVCAHPKARERVRAELASNGPANDPAGVHRLTFVEACVREAAYLYPTVTRTFHRARDGASLGGAAIPAGVDIAHSFPPIGLGEPRVRRFDPARWLAPGGGPTDFDPFLTGPRRCPGRDLITFVCTAALATMLERQNLVLVGMPLVPGALPAEFPRRGIRFRAAGET